jgi:hypothetical protein
LQMLARHTLIKYDPTVKRFLTCENSEEFEQYKNDPREFTAEASIPVESLKKLQIQDTIKYLYSSLKSRLFESSEPQETQAGLELDVIADKIAKYMPFLDKSVKLLEENMEFAKQYVKEQEQVAKAFEDVQDDDAELETTFKSVSKYYSHYGSMLRVVCQAPL